MIKTAYAHVQKCLSESFAQLMDTNKKKTNYVCNCRILETIEVEFFWKCPGKANRRPMKPFFSIPDILALMECA